MSELRTVQIEACARFRSLHASGCFVLPNPWDAGSAIYLEHLGFQALASTSAGFAFTKGIPDRVSAIGRDAMLDHLRELVAATSVPVNADFQSGFADTPDDVAENVKLCIETGVAGLSIEDNSGDEAESLYEQSLAVDRIRAAKEAIDASGYPVVLTARCEAWLVGDPDARTIARERLVAFAEAGADCLYAPGVTELDEIEALVKMVAPKPVNVLVSAPSDVLSLETLTAVGVRRISTGSALARVAWGAFMRAAQSIKETGRFDALRPTAPSAELNKLFG